jgi:DNA-binding response OmpR family regulator
MKEILLVEDDPFLLDIYTTKLNDYGFSVETASDGREGLKKLKEKKFELLILDIVLPNVDGWEVLKEISKDEELKKDLKIFILSNLGQKEEVERGFKMGIVKYFIKAHYTPTEVAEEIKKVLG